MKIVRRDHSISLMDRSNTRKLDGRNPGAGGSGRELVGCVIDVELGSLAKSFTGDQILNS
jgi:hypothetical protein